MYPAQLPRKYTSSTVLLPRVGFSPELLFPGGPERSERGLRPNNTGSSTSARTPSEVDRDPVGGAQPRRDYPDRGPPRLLHRDPPADSRVHRPPDHTFLLPVYRVHRYSGRTGPQPRPSETTWVGPPPGSRLGVTRSPSKTSVNFLSTAAPSAHPPRSRWSGAGSRAVPTPSCRGQSPPGPSRTRPLPRSGRGRLPGRPVGAGSGGCLKRRPSPNRSLARVKTNRLGTGSLQKFQTPGIQKDSILGTSDGTVGSPPSTSRGPSVRDRSAPTPTLRRPSGSTRVTRLG